MPIGDTELLNRWIQTRDADAFKMLCDRYARLPYTVSVRILSDATEAEDVTQECFEGLAGLKKAPSGPLGAWLHKVATYRALNRRRGAARRLEREQTFRDRQRKHTESAWDDICNFVDEAIADLPDKLQRAVVAHFLENQTHETIASAEGVSRAAITQRVHRGIDEIRKSLRRRGIQAGAATLASLLKNNLADAAPLPPSLQFALGKIALSGAGVPLKVGTGLLGGIMSVKAVAAVSTLLFAGLFAAFLLPRHEVPPRTIRVSAAPAAQPVVTGVKGDAGPIASRGVVLQTTPPMNGAEHGEDRASASTESAVIGSDIDDQVTLREVLETLDEIFAAVALVSSDSGEGALDANADGVLDGTENAEVRTVSIGSPAWREHLIAQGIDPDAPAYAEARAMWTPPPTEPDHSLNDAAAEIERIEAKHKVPSGQLKSLARLTSLSEELVFDVYTDGKGALAVSELVGVQDDAVQVEGFLIFELIRTGTGVYVIQDVDIEEYDGAVEEINRYLEQSGGSLLVPE